MDDDGENFTSVFCAVTTTGSSTTAAEMIVDCAGVEVKLIFNVINFNFKIDGLCYLRLLEKTACRK